MTMTEQKEKILKYTCEKCKKVFSISFPVDFPSSMVTDNKWTQCTCNDCFEKESKKEETNV
jgi:hypothetical protein